MATITWVVLKHHKKADGTYNPKIRITHNRTVAYMSTDIYTPFVKFKRGCSTGTISDGNISDCLNDSVRSIRQTLNTNPVAIEQLDTAKELVAFIERNKERQNLDIDYIEFAENYLSKISNTRTRNTHRSGIKVLGYYMIATTGSDKLPVKSFTVKLLMKFAAWLKTERVITVGNKKRTFHPMADNGVAIYMGSLKYVYNRLKDTYNDYETGDILIKAEPFKVYVPPRKRQVKKRAISKEDILKIYNYTPEKPSKAGKINNDVLARDMFIFSFLTAGMNAVDIYKCPRLQSDRIEYYRSKTTDRKITGDAFMSIVVTDYLQSIIEKYKDPKGERLFFFANR